MSAGKKKTGFVVSVLAAIFLMTETGWCDELTSGAPAEANDSLDGILSQAVPDSDLSVQGQGLEVNIGDIGLNAASNSAVVTGNQVSGNVDTGRIFLMSAASTRSCSTPATMSIFRATCRSTLS